VEVVVRYKQKPNKEVKLGAIKMFEKCYCASCGFGRSKKLRSYNWINKKKSRN